MAEQPHRPENHWWSRALLVAAVPVLVVGSVAWVFSREATSTFGALALPGIAMVVLALALALAVNWPWLRGFAIVLAATLVIGWMKVPDSPTATSHFAGASLGLLLMFTIARIAITPLRLWLTTLVFLCGGLAALVLGFAGTGSELQKALSVGPISAKVPAVRLGLTGMEATGDVNPNALAAVALMTVPVAASVLLFGFRKKPSVLWLQIVGFLVTLAGALVMILAQSRSAWIAIWLAIVVLLIRGLKSFLQRLLLGLLVLALPLGVIGRVQMMEREAFDPAAGRLWQSVHDRAHVMRSGAEQLRTSPLLGIGLNEFRSVYQYPTNQRYDVAHAHNMLLQTALDVGLLGLTAYCCILGCLFIRAEQVVRLGSGLCRGLVIGAAMSLVAVSAFGLADAVPLGAKVGTFQWMASGLILAVWRTSPLPTK